MPGDPLQWLPIKGNTNKTIGALGFHNDKVVVIVSFYADEDGNEDGKVSLGERIVSKISPISLKGRAIVAVAMAARTDLAVIERDASFAQEAVRYFLDFATGLVFDGFYAVYFSRGVKGLASGVARSATDSVVKQYVIRKGMEKVVKGLYDNGVGSRR